MSKKQAKPKKGFELSCVKQDKLTESSLRKFSDIIDQTIKLTNVEVGDQKNAKDRLKNSMITRVKKDYLSLTQHTYLLSIEAKSHEDWFKNQANYIFWLELFTYLQSHKIKCEYRINFYKELFDYLTKLEDENLFYLKQIYGIRSTTYPSYALNLAQLGALCISNLCATKPGQTRT